MHDATANVESLHREIARLRSAADHAERKLRAIGAIDDVLAGETSADTGVPHLLAGLGLRIGKSSMTHSILPRLSCQALPG